MADGTMSSAEMFGTAKKITLDLEQLPLHTHASIVNLITIGYQNRQVTEERREKLDRDEAQRAQHERQMALQERQIAMAEKHQAQMEADKLLRAAQGPSETPQ